MRYTYEDVIEDQTVEIEASYGGTFINCDVSLAKGSAFMSVFSGCRVDLTREEAANVGGNNGFICCEFKTPPSS